MSYSDFNSTEMMEIFNCASKIRDFIRLSDGEMDLKLVIEGVPFLPLDDGLYRLMIVIDDYLLKNELL